jgi:RNA polymerase sigma-70 factor (ECF subfamily)
MVAEAESLLFNASSFRAPGRYQLEAAIQSAHIERRLANRANWQAVVELYDALLVFSPTPVVAINRALAIAERDGAQAGFEALESVTADARLEQYQPWWAARADLLARNGKHEEARRAYDVAIGLEKDDSVRRFLDRRREALNQ